MKLHQALHGYADGHRQLASSLQLSTKDTKLVLVMSDVSGPGVATEGNSYITGYPLIDAGVYAIAKTWAATEMSRPGCVWTHTFFIDYADLARVEAPSSVSGYFSRPRAGEWQEYGVPAEVDLGEPSTPTRWGTSELDWLTIVLNALYGRPFERILARRDSTTDVDSLVLSAWDQQWPKLRRSFRFCTFTTKDRSTEVVPFDLQIAPRSEFSTRSRISGTLEALDLPKPLNSHWLSSLVQDVQVPNQSGLRSTLRLLGADILGGREAMMPLCKFHSIATDSSRSDPISEAISFIDEYKPLAASRQAKSYVVKVALNHINALDTASVKFVLENGHLLDSPALERSLPAIGSAIWGKDPELLLSTSSGSEEGHDFAKRLLTAIPVHRLLDELPPVPSERDAIVSARPEILEERGFWSSTQATPAEFSNTNVDFRSEAIFNAVLQGLNNRKAIESAARFYGSRFILTRLQAFVGGVGLDVCDISEWVKHACERPSDVAKFLVGYESPQRTLLELIAEQLPPDSVPNEGGEDPWVRALSKLREGSQELPLDLCAYGFARALGNRSRDAETLLQITFEVLYKAAAVQKLKGRYWKLIEGRLQKARIHDSPGQCSLLRKAVASIFLDRYLKPRAFAWLTESTELFEALMADMVELWGGRRFLREVEDSLRYDRDRLSSARLQLVRNFLSTHGRYW